MMNFMQAFFFFVPQFPHCSAIPLLRRPAECTYPPVTSIELPIPSHALSGVAWALQANPQGVEYV